MYKVFVRYREDLPESEMSFAAAHGFRLRGAETIPFHGFGDLEHYARELGPDVGVVGFVGDVLRAIEIQGFPRPEPLDYPFQLRGFLGREVRYASLGALRGTSNDPRLDASERDAAWFVKPRQDLKRFTGFIWQRQSDSARRRVATEPDDVEVWLSDPVKFVSEYRCFVCRGELLGVRHYKGDWTKSIQSYVVEDAIRAFAKPITFNEGTPQQCVRKAPAAYALDFGVTDRGQTLLVEVNDGFALGSYGLPPALYAQFLEARWRELCGENR